MQIVGFNQGDCKNTQLADQLRKVYRLRRKKLFWPRKKGPAGVRIEVKTGKAVDFVR